jgi:phosphatidylglycerophosphatase A
MRDILLWIALGFLLFTFYQMLKIVWGDDE